MEGCWMGDSIGSGTGTEGPTKSPYEPVAPESLDAINFLDANLQNCQYHAYRLL